MISNAMKKYVNEALLCIAPGIVNVKDVYKRTLSTWRFQVVHHFRWLCESYFRPGCEYSW